MLFPHSFRLHREIRDEIRLQGPKKPKIGAFTPVMIRFAAASTRIIFEKQLPSLSDPTEKKQMRAEKKNRHELAPLSVTRDKSPAF